MIRNVLLFLAGLVVAVGVLYVWPYGRSLLFGGGSGNLPTSGIRVVGGSLTAKLYGYTWSTDSPTQLGVTNADASSFALKNVSEKSGGTPKGISYSNVSGTWTIDEYVEDLQAEPSVEIVGSPGATISSGTVTMTTNNSGDSFNKSNSDRIYHNKNCPTDDKCPKNKLKIIKVNVGGSTDTWYCADQDRKCHVYIGSDQ
jgi:hypothetical protein